MLRVDMWRAHSTSHNQRPVVRLFRPSRGLTWTSLPRGGLPPLPPTRSQAERVAAGPSAPPPGRAPGTLSHRTAPGRLRTRRSGPAGTYPRLQPESRTRRSSESHTATERDDPAYHARVDPSVQQSQCGTHM
eukprot:1816155-Pyramimonas_sp.AAC.2